MGIYNQCAYDQSNDVSFHVDLNNNQISPFIKYNTTPIIIYYMSHKEHLNHFRKQIRRTQLDEIFQSRRIKMLNQHLQKMQTEQIGSVKKEEIHRMDMKAVATLSQTESGIAIINQSNYTEYIIKYLQTEFLNTDEQLYASYILCNLSVQPKTTPNYSYLEIILNLLEEASNQKVVDNLFCILSNCMCDYKTIRDVLVTKYDLVDRILAAFNRIQNITVALCVSVLNCILHMLHKSEPQVAYKKLRQFLIRFLRLEIKQENGKIFKVATYSLVMLTKIFPIDLLEYLIKGQVFQRLIQLFYTLQQPSFVSFILKMGDALMKNIKGCDFLRIFLGFIQKLSINDFQMNKTTNYHSKNMRRQSYKLINLALQLQKLQARVFLQSSIGKKMLEEFLVEEDHEILKELVFIFTNVYFNIQNINVLVAIEKGMGRAKEVDKSLEMVAHIEQLEASFHTR